MDGRYGMNRWAAALVVVVAAIVVGSVGYQFGVSRGLALGGQVAATPPGGFVPGGWYRPWGFGFPLLFLAFWFLILRGLFWGGPWRRRWHEMDPDHIPGRFEEWHRLSHERMKGTDGGTGSLS